MIFDLYFKLVQLKVRMDLVGDRLDLNAPKGVLTQELIAEIQDNKEGLIKLIRSYKKRKIVYNEIPCITAELEDYAVSDGQRRLWLLQELNKGLFGR